MAEREVGILGVNSLVGRCLLGALTQAGWGVAAYSRNTDKPVTAGIKWRQLDTSLSSAGGQNRDTQSFWVCVLPVWVLPDYFALLESHQARRVIVLSSTSRFTKTSSRNPQERRLAQHLIDAEKKVIDWATGNNVEWTILRPTLTYGLGRDKNIAEIARFIRRFGFFPVLGEARGLRQPIHADDVAIACVSALEAQNAVNKAYNLAGGETISYRDMVTRVFQAVNRPVRLIPIPRIVFQFGIALLKLVPRYRHWSYAMAERMNEDLVFDHSEASHVLDFKPRNFNLSPEDVAI